MGDKTASKPQFKIQNYGLRNLRSVGMWSSPSLPHSF